MESPSRPGFSGYPGPKNMSGRRWDGTALIRGGEGSGGDRVAATSSREGTIRKPYRRPSESSTQTWLRAGAVNAARAPLPGKRLPRRRIGARPELWHVGWRRLPVGARRIRPD